MTSIKLDKWVQISSTMNEEMKALYSNLCFTNPDSKVIGVISSSENEGKTFLCMELLKQYSNDGKKVCLIDCDLRKSKLHRRYTSSFDERPHGVSEYLQGLAKYEDIIYETDLKGAYIIFSGKTTRNGVNLFNKKNFDDLLNKLRTEYDAVIMDLPPVNLVIDGAIAASKTDGVLFVINSLETKQRNAVLAKKQLERCKIKILGAVLNFVQKSGNSYYYHGYYSSYYQSGSNTSRKKKH